MPPGPDADQPRTPSAGAATNAAQAGGSAADSDDMPQKIGGAAGAGNAPNS
ncbi:hypothetical protein MAUB1S_02536 [Mycolicibacterium aubagnense]